VDHIIEKSDGGDESLNNLWVLCPNCHVEKTRGVITIDLEKGVVKKREKTIDINNKHLFK